jgi:hypothetical protein
MHPQDELDSAIEHFRQCALDQGLSFDRDRLKTAVRTHRAMAPRLDRLRHIPLVFVGDVIEPSSATGWLESGDESR